MTCVLLTGGTGFLGGCTAFSLLHDERVDQLVLLCRASSEPEAHDRLRRSLQRFGAVEANWHKVSVVTGDLLTARLGAEWVDAITHVVHSAACTSFRSRREVRRSNVDGTAALAEQLRQGRRLERFLHVSTAYRCGAVSGPVVHEATPSAEEHVVEYTRTKAEAEALLHAMPSLPLLIARPSVVVGHTRLGVGPSSSLFWYYLALAQAGVAPFPEARHRDIVPVDYVAHALLHLLFLEAPRHREYHVSAGEVASNTWGELRLAFGQQGTSQMVPSPQLAAHPAWKVLAGNDARFRTALDLCARFAAIPIEWFANERLLETGMPAPTPFAGYVSTCLRSMKREASLLELLDDDA